MLHPLASTLLSLLPLPPLLANKLPNNPRIPHRHNDTNSPHSPQRLPIPPVSKNVLCQPEREVSYPGCDREGVGCWGVVQVINWAGGFRGGIREGPVGGETERAGVGERGEQRLDSRGEAYAAEEAGGGADEEGRGGREGERGRHYRLR